MSSASSTAKAILPGATIGIFGGGQLGRMTAMAARGMGYRILILDPDPACPARFVVDGCIEAGWDDSREAANLARGCDVVTLEIEQISPASMEAAASYAPVRPGGGMLAVIQDRIEQKNWLRRNGFPIGEYRAVRSLDELRSAVSALGGKCFCKSATGGYDGRGQGKVGFAKGAVIEDEIRGAWEALGERAGPDHAAGLGAVPRTGRRERRRKLCSWFEGGTTEPFGPDLLAVQPAGWRGCCREPLPALQLQAGPPYESLVACGSLPAGIARPLTRAAAHFADGELRVRRNAPRARRPATGSSRDGAGGAAGRGRPPGYCRSGPWPAFRKVSRPAYSISLKADDYPATAQESWTDVRALRLAAPGAGGRQMLGIHVLAPGPSYRRSSRGTGRTFCSRCCWSCRWRSAAATRCWRFAIAGDRRRACLVLTRGGLAWRLPWRSWVLLVTRWPAYRPRRESVGPRLAEVTPAPARPLPCR